MQETFKFHKLISIKGILIEKVRLAQKCARLTSFPAIKEFKISACKSFIVDAFIYEKDTLSKTEINQYLKKTHAISEIPNIIFNKAIDELKKEKILKIENNKYTISSEKRGEILKESEKNVEINNKMILSFLKRVKKFNKSLDESEEKLVTSFFLEILEKILDEMSNHLMDFFIGTKQLDLFTREEIYHILNEMTPKFYDDKLGRSFANALQMSFNEPDKDFSLGILLHSQNSIICDVLGKNIDIENFTKKIVSKNTIYLDTNVIIAALCTSSSDHKPIIEVLDSTKGLGVKIKIFDITENEFNYSCKNALDLKNNRRLGVFALKEGFNEIIDTYRKLAGYYDSFEDFIMELKAEYRNFKRNYGIEIIDTSKIKMEGYYITLGKKIIIEEFTKKKWDLNPVNIDHDIKVISYVQNLRMKNENINDINHWFLTRHDRLIYPDYKIASAIYSSSYQSAVKIDTWIEAIFPFLTVKNDIEISKAYTMSIGHTLVPMISAPDLNNFLKFSLSILGIDKKDEIYYIKLIERGINKKLIEKQLQKGENIEALKMIMEVLKDEKTIGGEKLIAEKDKTIEHQKIALRKRMAQIDDLTEKLQKYEITGDSNLQGPMTIIGDKNIVSYVGSGEGNLILDININNQINEVKAALLKLYPNVKEISENLKDIEKDTIKNKITRFEKIKEYLNKHKDQLTNIALNLINIVLAKLKETP